ncbi:hypothetical protein [Pseudoalteromonas sp. HM-SA03]|uniref:hypothetical protein n=1 Tax=Pseudoalteromonas sp. HM-SA03 TaxID=2029678 RepID=UPI0020D01C09|nr:hypothetical protein [Pseudoalteromonas sp. HM-SA03]
MKISVVENPEQQFIDFLGSKISELSWANCTVTERLPLAVEVKDESGEVVAGAAARTFGN